MFCRRWKSLLLFIPPIILIAFAFVRSPSSHRTAKPDRQAVEMATELADWNRSLLLDLKHCQIPDIDPDEAVRRGFVGLKSERVVDCSKHPALSYQRGHFIYIDPMLMKKMEKKRGKIRCCYRTVLRGRHSNPDNEYRFSDNCHVFGKSAKIRREFVYVECRQIKDPDEIVYLNVHAFVQRKSSRPVLTKKSGDDTFNVMVLGVGSVSRLNFHRQMKKTLRFLQNELGAIELVGYASIGDGKLANVAPITTGMNYSQLKSACWRGGHFDKCHFIWDYFSAMGYKTLLAEDAPDISPFNDQRKGFRKQPTDYYPRPLLMAADDEIGHQESLSANICLGPVTQTEFILRYIEQLLSSLRDDRLFLFGWINSMTSDEAEMASVADRFYHDFFRTLRQSGVLEDTIFFFLSDQGIETADVRNANVERRLPFNFLYLPPRFRQRHPGAVKTVEINSRKLTTAFDVYSTLVNLTGDAKTVNLLQSSNLRGSNSLFGDISDARSCATCGIHPNLCPCGLLQDLDRNPVIFNRMADLMIYKMNEELSKARVLSKCSAIKLSRIVAVWRMNVDSETEKKVNDDGVYELVIETQPGPKLFESMLRMVKKSLLIEKIRASNRNENRSNCVPKNSPIKQFCYCK